MLPIYVPYFIKESKHCEPFRNLIVTLEEVTEHERVLIADVCENLSNHGTRRTMSLECWSGDRDPIQWRARVPEWTDREKEYVIRCLRWEYYQIRTIYQLCIENENKQSKPKRAYVQVDLEVGD